MYRSHQNRGIIPAGFKGDIALVSRLRHDTYLDRDLARLSATGAMGEADRSAALEVGHGSSNNRLVWRLILIIRKSSIASRRITNVGGASVNRVGPRQSLLFHDDDVQSWNFVTAKPSLTCLYTAVQ